MTERLYWEDLPVGTVLWSDEVTADLDEMLDYALKNDPLPFHVDEAAAAKSVFGGLVASGGYTITLWYRSAVRLHSTIALLAGSEFSIKLPNPLRPGDSVKTKYEIEDSRKASKPGRAYTTSRQHLLNQNNEPVLICTAHWIVATRPEGENK
jgi:acyl dehydratase